MNVKQLVLFLSSVIFLAVSSLVNQNVILSWIIVWLAMWCGSVYSTNFAKVSLSAAGMVCMATSLSLVYIVLSPFDFPIPQFSVGIVAVLVVRLIQKKSTA